MKSRNGISEPRRNRRRKKKERKKQHDYSGELLGFASPVVLVELGLLFVMMQDVVKVNAVVVTPDGQGLPVW